MASSNSPPCAACKHMRQKCQPDCPYAPYFPAEYPQRFELVHKVFGASNVSKLLRDVNPSDREDAVKSLVYQAEARLRDPVNGCIGFISELKDRVKQIKTNIHNTMEELSTYLGPQTMKALEAMVENPSLVPPTGFQFMSGVGGKSGDLEVDLGMFNNVSPHQIQQQEGETHTLDPRSHHHPTEAQTSLIPKQTQSQRYKSSQHQPQEIGDQRGVGPSS